jgi:hypothetical protein
MDFKNGQLTNPLRRIYDPVEKQMTYKEREEQAKVIK